MGKFPLRLNNLVHPRLPWNEPEPKKLAQDVYADDATRFIETSVNAKVPNDLKRALNEARLETTSYEKMIQQLPPFPISYFLANY